MGLDELRINTNLYQEIKEEVTSTIIDCDILFPNLVTEEQKLKLMEIVKNCPISKILQGNLKVRVHGFRDGNAKTIKYGNEEITVLWKPEFCQHSTRCWTQLPQVFKLKERHWIDTNGAPADRIEEEVKRYPSGALVFIPAPNNVQP